MKIRREVVLTLTTLLVAAAVIVMPALAEEPFGVITSVDVESKKASFVTKGGEKRELEITGSTEIVNGKGEKVRLEAVAEAVAKAIKDGKKGVFARATYEKTVVSKISVGLPEAKKAKNGARRAPK